MTAEQEHSFYTTRVGPKAREGGFYVVNTQGPDGKLWMVLADRFPNHTAAEKEAARILAAEGIEGIMNLRSYIKPSNLSLRPTLTEQFEFAILTPGGVFRAWAEDQNRAQEIVAAIYPAWSAAYPDKPEMNPGQLLLDTLTVQRGLLTRRSWLDRLLGRAPYGYSCSLTSGKQVHGTVKASDVDNAALKAQADLKKLYG